MGPAARHRGCVCPRAVWGRGEVLNLLLDRFAPRRSDARAFALTHRVLLIASPDGVPIDVALAAFPFEFEALDRASLWEAAPGVVPATRCAEDLLVYRLVAARPQDLVDVESIVRRQRHALDVERIRRWGRELAELKDDPNLLQPFEDVLRQIAH